MEEKIEKVALSLGFDLVGFTSGKLPGKYLEAHHEWLEKGYEANMKYMKKPRINDSQSVIVLAKNYYYEQEPLKKDHGRVARYAYGRDYHKTIRKMLRELENFLKEDDATAKSYVDTGPVLERAFAEQANLGFIGKNSCLITPEFGSWVFIAVVLTNLDLKPNREPVKMSCGACTRCLNACPTNAITGQGVIDARKCISYHTIENRNEIPQEITNQIQKTKRIFGCDICQEVCPHNIARQKSSELPPKIAGDQIPATQIPTDEQFLETYAGSPLMRTKRKGLNRNLESIYKS